MVLYLLHSNIVIQKITVAGSMLLIAACLFTMQESTLKQLTIKKVAELAAHNPSYYIKAFYTFPHELSTSIIEHLVLTNKDKSALPIILLGYKYYQQLQQQQNNTHQHIIRLLLANNQQVQLTPEQSKELIQNSATIQNFIQGLVEHVKEIPLPLLSQEQITALLPSLAITSALHMSISTLPLLLQQDIPVITTLSFYYLKHTALQQLKEYLTTQTIPMLCDFIIAASYLDIQNNEHQNINFIELAIHALASKLVQSPYYQDEYTVINTLPNNIQRKLVHYLMDNSAIRYALCSNSINIITSTVQILKSNDYYSVNAVSWSPDNRYIASGSGDCTIKIWDAHSGTCIHTLQGHSGIVCSVAWSPDSKYIASGTGDKTIRVWDASTGSCIQILVGHTDFVISVSWSPDGKHLASCSWDKTVRIWNIHSGTCLHTFKDHTKKVSSVSWSPNGKYIASGSWDNTIQVWDALESTYIQTLSGHIRKLSWLPDSKYIAACSSKRINVWSIITGRCRCVLEDHATIINSVSWSPDGRYIASGFDSGIVKILDATTGTCIHTLTGHTDAVTSVDWAPDGSMIVSSSCDGALKIWSIINKEYNNYLKNTLAWEQVLLLIRLINQHDIDFTKDIYARRCYAGLPEDVKQLVTPLLSKSMRSTLNNTVHKSCIIS